MRLLIVEDERRLADIMARVFRTERYAVDVAYDGREGLDLALTGGYDAIVLDRMLPGMDGLDVLENLRAERLNTPVLMLTARAEVADRVDGLRAGADDYLGKPFALEEVVARVAALVRRREKPLIPREEMIVDIVIDFAGHQVLHHGLPINLSQQEYLLLELLAHNRGHVVARDVILERVWGFEADPQSNVVELYIHYLRRKIGRVSKEAAREITTVRGIGYMLAKAR
jgi:DNA-binding response OmpR family regulator